MAMLFFFLFIVLGAGLFFTIAFGLYKEEFPESNANKNNNIIPPYPNEYYIELMEKSIQYMQSVVSYRTYPEKDEYHNYKHIIDNDKEIIDYLVSTSTNEEIIKLANTMNDLYNKLFIEFGYKGILKKYIKTTISNNQELFNNIDGKSLDMQQREAVVADERSNLVIAGAGSGKTLTIAGKVKYLCTVKQIEPEKILLITFTKKAAEEMSERVVKRLGFNVEVKTFHSLGYDIVGQLKGDKPSVLDDTAKIYALFLSQVLFKDIKLQYSLFLYLSLYMRENISFGEYKKIGDYYKTLQCIKTETIKSKIDKFKAYKKKYKINSLNNVSDKQKFMSDTLLTYQKEQVKSYEELLIANYLFLNGVEYEYESNYKYKTASGYKRQYKPDFYLPKYDIYIEHFGIDEYGQCKQYSQAENLKYMEDIEWKRQLHEEYGTILEETYSYEYSNGTLFTKLDDIFKKHNITTSNIDKDLLHNYLEVLKTDNDFQELFNLINTFLTLFKANNYKQEDIIKMKQKKSSLLSSINPFKIDKQSLFFTIFEQYYKFYQEYLLSKNEIDFNDMINIGTELVISNELPEKFDYKYIIIDEYQDISVARYNLIKALRDKTGAKIMAVGDDWQSIYRFAGSDINLFTKFEQFFGTAYISKIEKTYRNSQSLIDIAGDFVMKNPAQITKKLISDENIINPIQYIDLTEKYTPYMSSPLDYLDFVLEKISNAYSDKKHKADVMILGRNNNDLDNILNNSLTSTLVDKYTIKHSRKAGTIQVIHSDYTNLSIRFLSVHKSKGLEADEVIIINNNNSTAGFPNLMVDDSILDYVLTSPEAYQYAEERRLFYVALTRTKNHCYLFLPPEPSVFILEMIDNYNIKNISEENESIEESEAILANQSCPKCSTGKLTIRTDSVSGEKFYGCSHYPYCNYTVSSKVINKMSNIIRCPECGNFMIKRTGSRGVFYGCINYPYCRYTANIEDINDITASKNIVTQDDIKRLNKLLKSL